MDNRTEARAGYVGTPVLAKTALVTGGTGQDGSYLIDLLSSKGYVVHLQSRRRPERESHKQAIQWHTGDLTDPAFLETLISSIRPDEIYNLAAISRPTLSWNIPSQTAQLNAIVPLQICELIRKHSPASRLFQASSSEIFGNSSERTQNEATRCDPISPYGIAKHYAHRIIGAYRERYGLHLASGIMFNHESPLRPLPYVSQKIAHAAAALSLGMSETAEKDERDQPIVSGGKLTLGGLDVRRDFGFAGDVVDAMHAILQTDVPDDYVIGTGENHSIAEFCEIAFSTVGLDWKRYVVVDSALVRRSDMMTCADPSKLRAKLGWHPKLSFAELVALMVNRRIEAISRPRA